MRGVTVIDIQDTAPKGKFLLTRLMRGVTPAWRSCPGNLSFLLTRLMRGVTCN